MTWGDSHRFSLSLSLSLENVQLMSCQVAKNNVEISLKNRLIKKSLSDGWKWAS